MKTEVKIDGCRKRRQKSPARVQWYSIYRARRFARRFGYRNEVSSTFASTATTASNKACHLPDSQH